MSREFLIVLPIQPMPREARYPKGAPFLLHCTVMPWFRLAQKENVNELRLRFALAFVTEKVFRYPIELISEKSALFGPRNDVPVHLLARTEELCNLHTALLLMLAHMESLPEELRWIGAGWSPHVTTCRSGVFPAGKRHFANRLALLRRDETGTSAVVHDYWPAKDATQRQLA